MTAKVNFTLRIPEELDKKLKKRATELGMSKNALILNLIWKEIEKIKR